MTRIIRLYFTILIFILAVTILTTWGWYLFDRSIPLFGKDGTLLAIASSVIAFFFGSSVVFWIVQWFFDRRESQKEIFLKNYTELHNLIIQENRSIQDDSILRKIHSFKEIPFARNILDITVFDWEANFWEQESTYRKNSEYVFELSYLLNTNRDFLKDSRTRGYILTKMSILWNLDLYYYYFIVRSVLTWQIEKFSIQYVNEKACSITISHRKDIEYLRWLIESWYFTKSLTDKRW